MTMTHFLYGVTLVLSPWLSYFVCKYGQYGRLHGQAVFNLYQRKTTNGNTKKESQHESEEDPDEGFGKATS